MKLCKACNTTKSLEDFHHRTKALDGRQTVCKDCNRKQRSAYYRTATGKENNQAQGKRTIVRNTLLLIDYLKEHACVDCGESDIVVLQFDHLDRSLKTAEISRMLKSNGWSRILEEIQKCEVVCANCHTRRTAKQFNWMKATA